MTRSQERRDVGLEGGTGRADHASALAGACPLPVLGGTEAGGAHTGRVLTIWEGRVVPGEGPTCLHVKKQLCGELAGVWWSCRVTGGGPGACAGADTLTSGPLSARGPGGLRPPRTGQQGGQGRPSAGQQPEPGLGRDCEQARGRERCPPGDQTRQRSRGAASGESGSRRLQTPTQRLSWEIDERAIYRHQGRTAATRRPSWEAAGGGAPGGPGGGWQALSLRREQEGLGRWQREAGELHLLSPPPASASHGCVGWGCCPRDSPLGEQGQAWIWGPGESIQVPSYLDKHHKCQDNPGGTLAP